MNCSDANPSLHKTALNDTKTYKIIIIGAGVAGLCASNILRDNNIDDYLILEARNRIGGRIIAINIEGRQLELGANWIHGVLGNPIYELASVNGLIPIVQSSSSHTVLAAMEDGAKLPFAILQEMYEVYSVFLKRCEEYFLCRYLPPEGVSSVGEHLRLERDLYLQKLPEQQRKSRLLVFDYLMRRETCIIGSGDLNAVDLMEIGSYTELPGGNISLPTGFSSILGPLAKHVPPEKILKGHAVSVVRWNNAAEDETQLLGAQMKEKQKVEILCDNGKVFYADSVICTVPLGVLKHSAKTMFQPPLPDNKMTSIEKLCYGTVDKIYLEYDRAFFTSELSELILLWDKTDDTADMASRWYRKIYSFTKINDTLLLGWISGEEAKYMETLSFEIVSEKCTEILRLFLADPFVPKPKRCICTSWWSQPYSRGSYSSIGVGGSQLDIQTIAAPLYAQPHHTIPSLLFAGEHCHPSFYSTVHGAYLSGLDAARYLCELPGIVNTQQDPVTAASDSSNSKQTRTQTSADADADEEARAPQTSSSRCENKNVSQKDASTSDLTLTVEGTADLSSWLHGISLN
uniref:Spermine oxidase-like n=1 Tax=Hirondellea gigas TaxID=1518452 RepID=A0A6A7GC95_9CRUS